MTHSTKENADTKQLSAAIPAPKEKPRKFQCHVCEKKFLGKNDLRKHLRIHTNERPYGCNECKMKFRQAGSLKNHITSKHSAGIQNKDIFICEYCKKAFLVKDRLRLHLRVHTGYKPYECKVCGKKFGRGGQLVQHKRTHTGVKPYACRICDQAFTCSANLKLHMNRHMERRDYVCDLCGKGFFRRDALKKHLSCYHANIKAFHCKICNKELKGHLPQHMRMHNQDKPHGCAHCGSRFAQRSQLTVHQRVHSGEKPYRCQVCWKAFAHSTALKLHIRQHTGEKPFACELCPTAFSQLPHLKKHMLCIHKSKKPYVCRYCKSFHKNKSELDTHYKTCSEKPETGDDDLESSSMALHNMRFKLAVLLKNISTTEKLDKLGFNKKLIDDVLVASIKNSGREPCTEYELSASERLKKNIQILLEWTVPKEYMNEFKRAQRSTEELLEELTSN